MRNTLLLVAAGAVVVLAVLYYVLVLSPPHISRPPEASHAAESPAAPEKFQAALDHAIKRLPPEYELTYKAARYSPQTGIATLSGVAFRRTVEPSFEVAAAEIEMSKPQLDWESAWSQAAASSATLAPDTPLPLADAVTLKGITFRIPNAAGTQESARIEGLRLYPWALLRPGMPSLAEAQAILLYPNRRPQPGDVIPLLRAEAPYVAGWGYDRATAENLEAKATVPAQAKSPAMNFSYSVRNFTASDYRFGAMADALVEGVTVRGDQMGTLSIERVVYAGIDMRKPLTRLLAGEEPSPAMLDGLALGRIEFGGIAVEPPSLPKMALGTFALSKIAFSHGVPASAELAWSGIRLVGAELPNPQLVAAFKQLGLEAATVSFGFTSAWNFDEKRIVNTARLKVDELGTLDLSLDFSDAAPGEAWWGNVRLAHGALRYDDASLVERALRLGAAQSGTEPAAFRRQLVALLEQQGAALGNDALVAEATKEVATFLDAPHSLALEAAPPEPIALAMFALAQGMPAKGIVPLLGLGVSANRDDGLNGRGVFSWSNGDRYEGDFKAGRFDGHGVVTYAHDGRYEGAFKDGKRVGHGVRLWADGERFEGEWKGDHPDRGVFAWADGQHYEGTFKDGHIHGRGVYVKANGDRYEGEFQDDVPNGQGTLRERNGESHAGEWKGGCLREGDRHVAVNIALSRCVGQ